MISSILPTSYQHIAEYSTGILYVSGWLAAHISGFFTVLLLAGIAFGRRGLLLMSVCLSACPWRVRGSPHRQAKDIFVVSAPFRI